MLYLKSKKKGRISKKLSQQKGRTPISPSGGFLKRSTLKKKSPKGIGDL